MLLLWHRSIEVERWRSNVLYVDVFDVFDFLMYGMMGFLSWLLLLMEEKEREERGPEQVFYRPAYEKDSRSTHEVHIMDLY